MKIKQVVIDSSLDVTEEIDEILSRLSIKPETVADPHTLYSRINQSTDPIGAAKSLLYITRNKGAVVRPCPGTSHYTCCDYTILHTGTFCTMDCAYCILQAYFHPPVLQYFAGLNLLEQELTHRFSQNRIFRIGTGEYTDSLIWEPFTPSPRFLVNTFARQSNSLLELKTKTVNVESLLDLDHNQKTVLAWSVNTPEIILSEERGTTRLETRLKTAKRCEAKGYPLAFHFDPLVLYDGCESAYARVIHDIFSYVRPESIVWISLGSFRFMPALKPIIEKRFASSTLCYGEFILGLDNKLRYFKPLRIRLYQKLVNLIKEYAPGVRVYFCMEDQEVWEKTMGFFPGEKGALGHLLDRAAVSHCRLNPDLL
jgi:spore photoproduct lyase